MKNYFYEINFHEFDFSDNKEAQYLQKNGNKAKFFDSFGGSPWFIEKADEASETFYMSFEETKSDKNTAESKQNFTLLQWGTNPNELDLIATQNQMVLGDERFHWKIVNPFDVILFKYPDEVSNSKIMYDFGGELKAYELRL